MLSFALSPSIPRMKEDKIAMATTDGEKHIWYGEGHKDVSTEPSLKIANEAVRGRDQFKARVRNFLKKKGGNAETPKTKEDLEKEIAAYQDYNTLEGEAITALSAASRVNSTYNRERTSGGKKIGRVAQEFVKSFSEFLGVYSGIVSIMKGAGQIYGEVAYEALSVLFIVVVNKSGNDSGIATLLVEMHQSFPKLQDWTDIYPTPSMKELVADVYKEVIKFARDASIYFTSFSNRLWMAFGKPPSMGIERTTSLIHSKLAEISSKAMVELHKRNKRIELKVEELKVTIEESHSTIQRLESLLEEAKLENEKYRLQEEQEKLNADKQRLETFKGILNITTFPTPPSDPDKCARIWKLAFQGTKKHQYQQMSRERLVSFSGYQSWMSIEDSSVLLLAGETNRNARAGRGYTHSWLSPATLYAAEILREMGGRVAYYCCHPGVRTDFNDLDIYLAKDLLIRLAYQLLEFQPKVLRKKMAQFQTLVNRPAWRDLDGDKKGSMLDSGYGPYEDDYELREKERMALSAWFSLLRGILEELKEEGCTYLIIDRLDLVDCKVSYFMEELVAMIKDDKYNVKVLSVIDTVRGEWDPDLEVKDSRVFVMQGLDQKQAGTFGHTFPRE